MASSDSGLDYTTCTCDELEKFIQIRRIKPTKSELEAILRQADRNTIFDLLKLPPELHNIIYNHVFDVKVVAANPNLPLTRVVADATILRTCKQVYIEASGLLQAQYDKYFFAFGTSFRKEPWLPRSDLVVHFNGRTLVSKAVMGDLKPSRTLAFEWPSMLHRVRCLDVRVHFEMQRYRLFEIHEAAVLMNDFLHQLHHYTTNQAGINAIRFLISINAVTNSQFMQCMLSPIPILASKYPNSQITYDNIAQPVQASLEGTTAAMRTLRSMESSIRNASVTSHCQRDRFISYDKLMLPLSELSKKLYAYVYASEQEVNECISEYRAILEEFENLEEQRKG